MHFAQFVSLLFTSKDMICDDDIHEEELSSPKVLPPAPDTPDLAVKS